MHASTPATPSDQAWTDLGFSDVTELGGGMQSRVFAVSSPEGRLAIKLTERALAKQSELERRAEVVARLAGIDASVVGPIPIAGNLVHPLDGWLATATPLIEGSRPDELTDGLAMGSYLADLHRSMRQLPPVDLPLVAALRTPAGATVDLGASTQVLHGDFSTANLLHTPSGLRIFDFDECGYGPVEYDVANTLFMDRFGRWVLGASMDDHHAFRTAFVHGYRNKARGPFDAARIDSLVEVRVRALRGWATDPGTAPIGIRTSAPEWLAMLRRFTDELLGRGEAEEASGP